MATSSSLFAPIVRWAAIAGPVKAAALSSLICLGLFYFAYNSYLSPLTADNKAQAHQLAQIRAQNQANQHLERQMPQFLADVRHAVDDYAVARALLPDAPEVSIVLTAVQKLAQARGVKVSLFHDTGQGEQSKLVDKLNERVVPIQILGSHHAIVGFLADLATYPRVLHVRDLAIVSQRGGESADVNLVCYFAPSPGDLPQLPAELQQQAFSTPSGGSATQ